MQRFSFCLLIYMAVLLTGCADNLDGTVNCSRINWYRLGYKDGSQGNYRQNLMRSFPSYGQNINADKTQYHAGWSLGVKAYCTPHNAFRLGEAGKMYNNVCRPQEISAFDKAWRAGITKFCTPHNAYMLALDGKDFPGFCPPNLNPAFHRAYNRGAEHYRQLSDVKDKLDQTAAELTQIQQQYQQAHHELRTMRIQYSQQSFSPQTQYKIQKLTLKVNRLAEQEVAVKAEQQKYRSRYNTLKQAFLKMD